MSSRLMTGPVSALVLIVATACAGGGGGTASPAASVAAPTRAAPSLAAPTVAASAPAQGCATDSTEGEAVTIVDFSYDPDALTVPAGTAVAWTNNDAGPHTVTFDEGPDCGELNNGDTVALTFDTAGEFSYFCQLHPNMRASITVQ